MRGAPPLWFNLTLVPLAVGQRVTNAGGIFTQEPWEYARVRDRCISVLGEVRFMVRSSLLKRISAGFLTGFFVYPWFLR